MLIVKGVLLGVALFLVCALIYMIAEPRLIRPPGIGIISTNSPFLWLGFAASLAIGYLVALRGLWIVEGVLLGLVMFMVGTAGYWIAYPRVLNLPPPPPGVAVGINIPHLLPWLFVALISSLGLGLAVVAIWQPRGTPVP
jgi:hypothetical protein